MVWVVQLRFQFEWNPVINQRKIIENILIIEGLWNWDGDLIYQDFGIVWEMLSGFLIS